MRRPQLLLRVLLVWGVLLLVLPPASGYSQTLQSSVPQSAGQPVAGMLAVLSAGTGDVSLPTLRLRQGPDEPAYAVRIPVAQLAKGAIAPDGRYFVYTSGGASRPGEPLQSDLALHVVRIADGIQVRRIDLLPTNFPDNVAENAALLLARDGSLGNMRDLEEAVWMAFVSGLGYFAWSPDGQFLAFSGALDGPSSDLYLYEPAGNTITRLTDGIEQIAGLRWSPDGEWIWQSTVSYSYCQVCDGHQYASTVDGTRNVTLPGDDVQRFLGWIRPASYLETDQANGPGDFDLRVVDIATQEATTIWPGTHQAFALDLAAQRLAVIGTEAPSYSPETTVYVVGLATGERRTTSKAALALSSDGLLAALNEANSYPCEGQPYIVRPCRTTAGDPRSPTDDAFVDETGALVGEDGTQLLPPDSRLAGGAVYWLPDGAGYFVQRDATVYYRVRATGQVRQKDTQVLAVAWLPAAVHRAVFQDPLRGGKLDESTAEAALRLRLAQVEELATIAQVTHTAGVAPETVRDGLPLLLAREAGLTAAESLAGLPPLPPIPAVDAALETVLAQAPAWVGSFPAGGSLPALRTLALQPSGELVATGHSDGSVRLWEMQSGALYRMIPAADNAINQLAFSDDGMRLAIAAFDGRVHIWDVARSVMRAVHWESEAYIAALAWQPGTYDYAMSTGSGPVQLLGTNGVATTLIEQPAEQLAFHPDGTRLAAALRGSGDDTDAPVVVVDAATGERLLTIPDDDINDILAYSPDGATLLVESHGLLRAWNGETGDLLWEAELPDTPNGTSFTADGTGFAMLSRRAGLTVWSVATGEMIQSTPLDGDVVAWLAAHPFVPVYVTGAIGGRPVFLDAETGAASYPFDGTRAQHLAADALFGRTVAVANGTRVTLRDVASQRIDKILDGPTDTVTALAFGPTGDTLVAGETNGMVTVWNAYAGDIQWRGPVLDGSVKTLIWGETVLLALGEDGTLVSASIDSTPGDSTLGLHEQARVVLPGRAADMVLGGDGTLYVALEEGLAAYDPETLIGGTIEPDTGGAVTALAINPDSTQLAVARRGASVELWDTVEEGVIQTLGPLDAYQIDALAFGRADSTLAIGATSSTGIMLWDLDAAQDNLDTALGDDVQTLTSRDAVRPTARLAFAGDMLLAEDNSGVVNLYALYETRWLRQMAGHAGSVWDVTLSPNGKLALTAGDDQSVRVWDWQTGAQKHRLPIQPERAYSVAYRPQGDAIAVGGYDGDIRVYFPTGASQLLNTLTGHTAWIETVLYSPDGSKLASASADGSVRLWDALAGTELWAAMELGQGVKALAFSPDGTRLAGAAGVQAATIYVWDVATGAVVDEWTAHDGLVAALAYSPNGAYLASASWDTTAKLWDADTGAALATLIGHSDILTDLAFTPDGTKLITLAEDYLASVWAVPSGDLVEQMDLGGALPWALAVSSDGTAFLTAHADGVVRSWLIDPVDASQSAQLLRAAARVPRGTAEFTPAERRMYAIDAHVGAYGLTASASVNLQEAPHLLALIVLPGEPERLVGLTNEHFLIVSANQGESWSILSKVPATIQAEGLALPARADDPLLIFGQRGLYRYQEDGTILLVHSDRFAAVSYAPTSPDTLWGVVDGEVRKSDDGGTTWASADNGLGMSQLYGPLILTPPNGNPQVLAAAGMGYVGVRFWRGAGNGFWEALPAPASRPTEIAHPYGLAWDAGNRTLYFGTIGDAARDAALYEVMNLDAPNVADVTAERVAGLDVAGSPQPLAVGAGPTLYLTVYTSYGPQLVRATWSDGNWQVRALPLPMVAAG